MRSIMQEKRQIEMPEMADGFISKERQVVGEDEFTFPLYRILPLEQGPAALRVGISLQRWHLVLYHPQRKARVIRWRPDRATGFRATVSNPGVKHVAVSAKTFANLCRKILGGEYQPSLQMDISSYEKAQLLTIPAGRAYLRHCERLAMPAGELYFAAKREIMDIGQETFERMLSLDPKRAVEEAKNMLT